MFPTLADFLVPTSFVLTQTINLGCVQKQSVLEPTTYFVSTALSKLIQKRCPMKAT